jgi:hypothetical protein
MKDVRFTKDSGIWDMKLEGGDFPWCEEGTQVANHAMQKIQTFRGERLIDKNWGTQWYEIIFNVERPQAEKELEIKRQILTTPGTLYIEEFAMVQVGMEYRITGIAQTEFSTESFDMVMSL